MNKGPALLHCARLTAAAAALFDLHQCLGPASAKAGGTESGGPMFDSPLAALGGSSLRKSGDRCVALAAPNGSVAAHL